MPWRNPAASGVKATFTVQVVPAVTAPMQVLPLARLKSRYFRPPVETCGSPSVALALTL